MQAFWHFMAFYDILWHFMIYTVDMVYTVDKTTRAPAVLKIDLMHIILKVDKLLDEENIEEVISLVTNSDQQANMKLLLKELSFLNKVIQSLHPKEHFNMREFDERAKNFQLFLLSKFPWVNWPDYLHVGLGHATELLKECDSLALYSAQSKEAKNRLTRIFKERFSRKNTNILSIQDVFTRDWILTSPVLRGVGTTKPERKRNHRCSKLSRSTPH